jgi:hypothetical protein
MTLYGRFARKGFADDSQGKVPASRLFLAGVTGVGLAVVDDFQQGGCQVLFQAYSDFFSSFSH